MQKPGAMRNHSRLALTLSAATSLMLATGCMSELDPLDDTPPGVSPDTDSLPGSQSASDAGAGTAAPLPDARVVVPDAAPPPPPCMAMNGNTVTQDPLTGHCYMFFDRLKQEEDARNACTAYAPNTHLATLTSQAEHDRVYAILGETEAWIGLGDSLNEGSFVWLTGEPLGFTWWAPDEPNNGGNVLEEDCTISNARDTDGKWDDRACTMTYAYVCERDR